MHGKGVNMFIRYGIKKVKYGLVILVVISSAEVRCSSYDYLKSTLPYAAVLAFIATNYYRRSLAQPSNAYDTLSYAVPIVAVGAGSLLAQPDNWRGAFVRSLPAMIFALGAVGLERINTPKLSGNNAVIVTGNSPQHSSSQRNQKIENPAILSGEPSASLVTSCLTTEPVSFSLDQKRVQTHQDQPPIGQKVETREDLVRYFLEQKTKFEELVDQYRPQFNKIGPIVDAIFATDDPTTYSKMLVAVYKESDKIYNIYKELQTVATKIKQLINDENKSRLIDMYWKDVAKLMGSVDPVQAVAIAAYTNALINLYIKVGKNESRSIIELMPEVLNIQDFFNKYGLSFNDDGDVTDLIAKVEPSVREKFELFKNFDQETSRRVGKFSNLTEQLNDYLKSNNKEKFKSNFENINNYYNSMNEWFQEHEQEIHNIGARVEHVFKTNLVVDRYNTYENIIRMLQRPWQSYAIALLQHHYKDRIGKNFTYSKLLSQARKSNYINQKQYDNLDAFIDAVDKDLALQAAINWWLDILIGIDKDEQTVRPVKGGNETSSVLSRGKSKKVGRRR